MNNFGSSPGGPDSTHNGIFSEIMWLSLIVASTTGVVFFTIYCLLQGITTIFMHLYYFPVILLAYHYRYRGFVLATFVSLVYVGLVYLYDAGQADVISGAWLRFFAFVGVAAVVAYLSEHLCEDQNAIRESEKKLRALFENMLEGFAYCRMIYDADGRPSDWVYLEVNTAFGRLTGLKDITGKRVLEAIPDIRTQTPELFDTYGRVASTGRPETFEIDFTPLKMWLKVSVFSPAKGDFVAVFEDITDLKRAAEEHLRLAAIVEFSDDAIIGKNLDGIIVSWNTGAEHLYGYTAEEATGKPVSFLVPPGERDETPGILERIRGGELISHLETKRRTKDGRVIDVSLTISPIKDRKGTVQGASAIARDITGRKRAEEALRESEKRYRDMFELNDAVMFIVNPATGRIVDANSSASRYYGYTSEELSGMVITEINIAEPDITRKNMSHAVENHGEVFQFRHRKKNGEIRDVEVFSAPVTLGGQKLLHSIVQDVTERNLAEEALRQANTKLNLLSSITRHDIKNQIFALKAYLELSRETLSDAVKTSEFILKEERAVNAMERQITFTKEYQDLGVKSPVWEDVEESIRKALASLPVRDIRVAAEVSDLDVFADPLFERVFYNLIDNALRYGGQKMTMIRITSQESETGLVISVEDNGGGISAEDKKRLFERGFGHHTGLGLFLSREILAITGITIIETGEPGTGARFEILVPKGVYRSGGVTGNREGYVQPGIDR
ncbi:PAS domain S-box protein [Methanoregula sp.]|uniref:PAS domain-containing protein n=1 Tax=Methanoregula sp. TaxID=2052170 RepID=UPI003C71FE72